MGQLSLEEFLKGNVKCSRKNFNRESLIVVCKKYIVGKCGGCEESGPDWEKGLGGYNLTDCALSLQ